MEVWAWYQVVVSNPMHCRKRSLQGRWGLGIRLCLATTRHCKRGGPQQDLRPASLLQSRQNQGRAQRLESGGEHLADGGLEPHPGGGGAAEPLDGRGYI